MTPGRLPGLLRLRHRIDQVDLVNKSGIRHLVLHGFRLHFVPSASCVILDPRDRGSFEPGNLAMLIGGNHVGEFANISRYEEIKNPKPNIVYFEGFSTIKDYVFIVGQEKPEITTPDVNVLENEEPKKETTEPTEESS